jgi:hypothetical protein
MSARLQEFEEIAKVTSTMLGYEDHGILTAYLQLDFGGSGQAAGGYGFDEYDRENDRRVAGACGMEFVAGVIRACGVDRWEKVAGRTVIAIRDTAGWNGKVIGLRPLPTERGEQFIFADAFAAASPSPETRDG